MESVVGKRLKAAREQADLTQQELSDRLGFKNRQTLQAIEAGQRKVTADELVAAMRILGRDLDYFTDPLRLDGEARYSWRTSADTAVLSDFEATAGRWLATFRQLVQAPESKTVPLHLDLTSSSSYEDARAAAEWLVREWKLGETPAVSLEAAIRSRLQALVLYVDAPEGVSGAAVKLPGLSAMLINRNDPVGRRNFDVAHELFHLLTWETMPPAYAHDPDTPAVGQKRVEQLANCFASSLLMPEQSVQAVWPGAPIRDGGPWEGWLNKCAQEFRVSTLAFQWRLVSLDLLAKEAVDNELSWESDTDTPAEIPELYSRGLVEAVNGAVEAGKISVRRAAGLLDMTINEMAELMERYGIEAAFDV